MPIYTCERCLKEFSQKSHFNKHQNKKLPCQDNKKKIEQVVDNIIINKKLIYKNIITHLCVVAVGSGCEWVCVRVCGVCM